MIIEPSDSHKCRLAAKHCSQDQIRRLSLAMEAAFREHDDDIAVFSKNERQFFLLSFFYRFALSNERLDPGLSGVCFFFNQFPDAQYRQLLEALSSLGEDEIRSDVELIKLIVFSDKPLPSCEAERTDRFDQRLFQENEDSRFLDSKCLKLDKLIQEGPAITRLISFAQCHDLITDLGIWSGSTEEAINAHQSRTTSLRLKVFSERPKKIELASFHFSEPPRQPAISHKVAETARKTLSRIGNLSSLIVFLVVVIGSLLILGLTGLMFEAGGLWRIPFYVIIMGICLSFGFVLFLPLGFIGGKLVGFMVEKTMSWRIKRICMDYNQSWGEFMDLEAGRLHEWLQTHVWSLEQYEGDLAEWLELRDGGKLTKQYRQHISRLIKEHYLVSSTPADLQVWQQTLVDYCMQDASKQWLRLNEFIKPSAPYPEFAD